MQGERATLGGSLSETMNFEHGSTSSNAVIDQQIRWENIHNRGDNDLQDYMVSAAATNTTFPNSVYHEQRGLHRPFSLGEASSSGIKNEAPRHSEQWNEAPLFMQPSSGNRVVGNVNLNEHLQDMNPVTGHPGLSEVNGQGSRLLQENSVRAGSSVDGRGASRKRKANDGSIGQFSSNGAFREYQRGESSSWVSAPAFHSPANNLNISLDHGPRGLVSGAVPHPSIPAIAESSSRNFSVRVNPTDQQETVSPAVFSAGSVIRRPVAPALGLPVNHVQAVQHLIELRNRYALGSFAPQHPNAPAIRMPHVSRNMAPPFQWSGSPVAAGGSSISVSHRDETRQRSNILENHLFAPAPELRNLAQGHISRDASRAGHVASSSSGASLQPSPSIPAWTPYQNHSPHNERRLSALRRSLLSSLATNQRAARSLAPPASQDEHVLQSGGGNTSQVQNRTYSRASPRQGGQAAIGIPHSLRGLASTSRGRSRMGASEIRNVLDHLRRTGNLPYEDAMLLSQSMARGAAGNNDRYRDMRLDVDNMTYEELLSLQERIGDVCTGLNEETISNKLKRKRYSGTKSQQEVEPCCICQEEYKEGEEMGMLECRHGFHSECIKEWLMQKNVCPICKATGLNTAKKPRRS